VEIGNATLDTSPAGCRGNSPRDASHVRACLALIMIALVARVAAAMALDGSPDVAGMGATAIYTAFTFSAPGGNE
jgi:hypothetical protein